MSKFKYSEVERQLNAVLKYQHESLADIHFPSAEENAATIAKAEELLRHLGYKPEALKGVTSSQQKKITMTVPTWEELCDT